MHCLLISYQINPELTRLLMLCLTIDEISQILLLLYQLGNLNLFTIDLWLILALETLVFIL